jgi:hypothetical protein
MADGGYWGLLIRSTSTRRSANDGLEADANMYVTFPHPEFQDQWERNLVPKVALRVGANQLAGLRLAYLDQAGGADRFVPFTPLPAAGPQVDRLFGRAQDEAWVVLAPQQAIVPGFPAFNVAHWRLRLQIAPRRDQLQVIPAVVVNTRSEFAPQQQLATFWVITLGN